MSRPSPALTSTPRPRRARDAAVAINCRFLETEMRGIGRYATAMAEALRQARPGDVRCVFSGRVAPHLVEVARSLGAEGVGPLGGPLWEQVTLPAYLAMTGRPLLVNFVNTAPLFYAPQVTVVYDLAWKRHPESFTPSFLALYRTVVPRVLERSRIVTISEFVKGELVAAGAPPGRVDVVPAFVPPEILELARRAPLTDEGEQEPGYALVVGSLNRRKNLQAAIAAFREAAVPGLRLVVVGESAAVFRATPAIGADDARIELRGAVSDEELVRLYRGARFLVFPSLYEGFGIPPLEAMACGCPVLASSASSIPEVCGDAALYCDPASVSDMARGIARMAGDAGLREALRQRGAGRVRAFSAERSGAMFASVVERELATRGRRAAGPVREHAA